MTTTQHPGQTCWVQLHRGGRCGAPAKARGLCAFHYPRHRAGWSDDELGLPRSARRTAPAPGCQIVMHTGEPCSGTRVAGGVCHTHRWRKKAGWTDRDLGLPIGTRRPRTAVTAVPCPIEMHDGQPCGRPVRRAGHCDGHYQRLASGWPQDRLGEPWQGQPTCKALLTHTKRCRQPVAVPGDRCPTHSEDTPPLPTSPTDAEVRAHAARVRATRNHRSGTAEPRRSQLAQFHAWGQRHRIDTTIPVPVTTVAAYLGTMSDPARLDPERRRARPYAPSTLQKAASAIRDAHLTAGHPSPTDDPAIQAIIKGAKVSGPAPKEILRFGPGEMRRLVATGPAPSPTTRYLRAAVLVAHALDVPIADLVDARVRHLPGQVHVTVDGAAEVALTAGRRPDQCPVHALEPLADLGEQPFTQRPAGRRLGRNEQRHWLLTQTETAARRARLGALPDRLGDLDPGRLHRLLTAIDRDRFLHVRDRAIYLVAWHLGLDHSDWSRLRWATDLTRETTHYRLQGLRNRPVLELHPTRDPALCPVTALDGWLALCPPASGQIVFTSTRVTAGAPAPLTIPNVTLRLKAAAAAVSIVGKVATSSLALGYLDTALAQGGDPVAIQRTLGRQDLRPILERRARIRRRANATRAMQGLST